MDYQQLIDTMSPAIYQSLKRSLEVGKWPDGKSLTAQQRHNTMAAIIVWGEKHLPEKERVGYIDKGHKAGDNCDDPGETTLNWKE
jgi:uncharacterized protein YeaC (DUF1315 family)